MAPFPYVPVILHKVFPSLKGRSVLVRLSLRVTVTL